jgi:hypothetical protein
MSKVSAIAWFKTPPEKRISGNVARGIWAFSIRRRVRQYSSRVETIASTSRETAIHALTSHMLLEVGCGRRSSFFFS